MKLVIMMKTVNLAPEIALYAENHIHSNLVPAL